MSFFYTGNGRHDLAGCAVPALKPITFYKRLLHRVQLAAIGQAFNGSNLFACRLRRKSKTAQYPLTIYMNRAGAALTVIATFLVPVSCNSSLSRSSKVVRVSGVTLYGFLLILIVRGIVCLGGTKSF